MIHIFAPHRCTTPRGRRHQGTQTIQQTHLILRPRPGLLRQRPLARSLPEVITSEFGTPEKWVFSPWKFGDSELENPPFFKGICKVLGSVDPAWYMALCPRKCGDKSATLKNCQQVRQVCVYLCPW